MSAPEAGVRIDEGGLEDVGPLMAVMRDSFDPAYGEAWTAAQCAGLLPLPGVWLRLARAGADIVGFALARIIADEAELLLLAVRSQSQRSGVGRKLLEDFVACAEAKGAHRLHLEVRDGNHALGLYARAGFEEVGRRRNYYSGAGGQSFDALTLSKRSSG